MLNLRIDEDKLFCDRRINKKKQTIDVSDYLLYHLKDECYIKKGTTLFDIANLIEPYIDELSPCLTYSADWLRDIIDEMRQPSDEKSVDQIMLSWIISVDDDIFSNGTVLNEEISTYGLRDDYLGSYAIEFTPAYKLSNAEVVLDYNVDIQDGRKKVRDKFYNLRHKNNLEKKNNLPIHPLFIKTKKKFTLLDILYGIFFELSRHGSPQNRDKAIGELAKRIEESKKSKALSSDEVMKRIKERFKNEKP